MRINLVQGHSAGGLLRRACRQFGLPGEVRVIDDELSVGPLSDDQVRNEWWRTVYGPYPEAHQPSLYDQWQAICDDIGAAGELVLWSSDSARDYVFGRMAAFMLGGRAAILQVLVPPSGKLEGVPFHGPDVLAGMESNRRALTTIEVASWGESFANQLRQSSGIRLLHEDSITARPENAFDEYLLERCPLDWTKWYRPIGEAIADCDGQNLIGDAFFSWRLRLLVEAGRVEAQGDPMSSDGPENVLVRRTFAT
jgi:hypothetical protein